MWLTAQDPVTGFRKVQFGSLSGIVPPVEITVFIFKRDSIVC
jgi:hypothetical protein